MFSQLTLREIIESKIFLPAENARGFHEVVCASCGDYQKRGAFKFEGDLTVYTCWNCKAAFKYEESTGRLSYNAKKILESFGIGREDLLMLKSPLLNHVEKEDVTIDLQLLKKQKLNTPEVKLPPKSFPIGHSDFETLQIPLVEYLDARCIDAIKSKTHFSLHPKYENRVIIPFYRDGKIIYWQARHIDNSAKPRYLNCSAARDAVMYGYHQLRYDNTPLFVTEGVFDAIVLDGLCLLGSSLNEVKIDILHKTKRRIIFVLDRDSNGGLLGKEALAQGWEISFVDKRAKDANDSVVKFGMLYTIYSLMKNATKNLPTERAQILLDLGILQGKMGAYK